ncbi:type III restriction enzyme [Pilibacter termitis]|uniref:Type III restriction enzyme n=1 Tax=Pilibacter termitis TaxID=263852 RepID=A0A1T4PZN8_9ENTE|nr:DEAD/DEAH box helicase family protein [Pilibacter termitis]SJZ96965.1 type III restriction enzyme [Pilibacter termitis]
MAKKKNILPLPLWEEMKEKDNDFTFSEHGWELPDYLRKDGCLKHVLRDYQETAIRFFHYAMKDNYRTFSHLLFNMATGSGKTDLMAGLLLYCYQECKIQNFLFIVNTQGVLTKTIDNLTNRQSGKYLFNETIEMNGERITIEKVERFPVHQAKNTIYLKLATIQAVSSDLFTVKENSMGRSSYEKNPVVILGDEAHHYSASTKSDKEKEQTWENAIYSILTANAQNKLLEFTATIDLDNKNTYEKYKDKILYKYTLDKFIYDGFSKDVLRIETSSTDREKMLDAVLLSQLRKDIGRQHDVNFKPIILFKSQKIIHSLEAEKMFHEMIENLTVEEVYSFVKRQKSKENGEYTPLLASYIRIEKAYENGELGELVATIQCDFSKKNVLNANDSDRGGSMLEKGDYQALNTLESPNNFYRVVFAVAKLTEGWDVLNLFDIVRLSENADGKKAQTNSEAQLIGRGARYYPFIYNGKRSFTRRFDREVKSNLRLLETLHYHTANETQYLKNLVQSLEEMNLPTGRDIKMPKVEAKVKPAFKKSATYKEGKLYYNKVEQVADDFYTDIAKYGIDNTQDVTINLISTNREMRYKSKVQTEVDTKLVALFENGIVPIRFYKKAMSRNTFFYFDRLKQIVPCLSSMAEFLGENWLNAEKRKVFVTIPKNMSSREISAEQKLFAVEKMLKNIEMTLKANFQKARGTNVFAPIPINELIQDYSKYPTNRDTMENFAQRIDGFAIKEDWFVYDTAIVNQTEKELLGKMGVLIRNLKEKGEYKEVYCLRLDEQNYYRDEHGNKLSLKLHQFTKQEVQDVEVYNGFMPDFVLYVDGREIIQVFVEPKNAELAIGKDKWKEDLLLSLENAEIAFEDSAENVRLLGVKFYTNSGEKKDVYGTFSQLEEILDLQEIREYEQSLFVAEEWND